MILIVAEKKSVAVELAKAIGSSMSLDRGVVNCRHAGAEVALIYPNGHALRCLYPDEMDPLYKRWNLEHLPIVPAEYKFQHTPTTAQAKNCINFLNKHHAQAHEIVNACDAGREGELIFKELMEYVGIDPYGDSVTRMWILDTTCEGLKQAFENRSVANCKKYRSLGISAQTRKFSDWIYGINATRYYEISKRTSWDNRKIIGVGRVKTPLLSAIDLKCRRLDQWQPTAYYQGYVTFRTDEGKYDALLLAPEYMRFGRSDISFRDGGELAHYFRKIEKTIGMDYVVEDKSKEVTEYYYPPFNMSDVIRSASRILNWNGERTMQALQNLYEKDQAISYPRTESNHFPSSMQIRLRQQLDWVLSNYLIPEFPDLERIEIPEYVVDRWLNDKKSQDHHAIMPIGEPMVLDESGNLRDEYTLWELITKRYFLSFLAPATVLAFSRISMIENEDKSVFKTMMKSAPILEPGYLSVHEIIGGTEYRKELRLSQRRRKNPHPKPVKFAKVKGYQLMRRKTLKPNLFNDDSLISYMEQEKLGTVATRIGIIKELLDREAIRRDSQNFYYITEEGQELLEHIKANEVPEMLNTEIAKTWEQQLDKIAEGTQTAIDPVCFLDGVTAKVRELGMRLNTDGYVEEVTICPKSGQPVEFSANGYIFPGWKKMEFPYQYRGRSMTGGEWMQVITSGSRGGGPFTFHSDRTNADYKAFLVFKRRDLKVEMVFKRRYRH